MSDATSNTISTNSSQDKFVLIGKITSAFGIKGWVKVYSYTDPHQNIAQYRPWCLSSSQETPTQLKPVTPLEVKPQGKVLVARLESCDDRNQAESYHGLWIWAKQTQLPELEEDEFYWRDLEGLTVFNQQNECLGKVHQLMETGANDVLQVNPTPESLDSQQRLIPYVWDHYIVSVDLDKQEMHVDWESDF